MLDKFNKMSMISRIIVAMVALIVAWLAIRLVLGLLALLLPLAFLAAVVVAGLWLYQKIRDA